MFLRLFALDPMKAILPSPQGDEALFQRAKEIQSRYGAAVPQMEFHIALVELSKSGPSVFLTFDKDVVNQVLRNAPSVKTDLVPV